MIYALLILAIAAFLWPGFMKRTLKYVLIGAACIVALVTIIAATQPTPKAPGGAVQASERRKEVEAFDYAISEANKIPMPVKHFNQEVYSQFLKMDVQGKKFGDCVANQIKLHGWLAHATQHEMSARYKKYGATCFDLGESVEGIGEDKISAEAIAFDMVDCKFDSDHPMLDADGNFDQRNTSGDPMTCRDRTISHWRQANSAAKYRAETPD